MSLLEKLASTGSNGFSDEELQAFIQIALVVLLVLGAIVYVFFEIVWQYL